MLINHTLDYLWYIQNGAPKLLLMAQPLKHPQSESVAMSYYIYNWHDPCYKPTLVATRIDMGVAEFKSARRWKKNLTRRRAEVQVNRIWFSQVKWLEIFASQKFRLVGNYFRQLKTTRRLVIA